MIPKKDKTRLVNAKPNPLNKLLSIDDADYYDTSLEAAEMSDKVRRNFAEAMLADAKEKYKNDTMGLRSILLADASNKPPTLDDYVKLGLSLSQLSESERESIQFMLDKSQPKPEDKK